jgi:hypothetical protein
MSERHDEDRARELESARMREFEARLEQEYAGEPPVAAILRRAADGPRRRSQAIVWLTAAVVLLAFGVTLAMAFYSRGEDDQADDRQDREAPIELRWPEGVPRVYRPEQLPEVPADVPMLSIGMPVYTAADLSRFSSLRQLDVRLTVKTLGRLMREGEPPAGTRLQALATAPQLRRVSFDFYSLVPADLEALRHLERLQVLELSGIVEINDALRAAAQRGGAVECSPFDAAFGRAVAAHSRARTLRISGMPITAAGIRALADAGLHTLTLDASGGVTAAALEALAELRTLRRLTLRSVHGASIDERAAGMVTRTGSRVWSRAAMLRISELPNLESLTLDTCYLDDEVVAALPRTLLRLDLSTCFGVDARLVDVVARMERLHTIGLPLRMAEAKDYTGSWRPWARDSDLHTRRLDGEAAAAILRSRPWRELLLDGRIPDRVADALRNQDALQSLILNPTDGSASLSFVASMPKLEQIWFVESDLLEGELKPINACASLQRVVFEDCTHGRVIGVPVDVLREGLEVRMVTRMIN